VDDRRKFGLASARAATLGGNTVQSTRPAAFDLRKREAGAESFRNYSLMAHQMRRQNKLDADAVKQQRFQNDITLQNARRADALAQENIASSRQNREQSAEMQPERVKGAKIANEAGKVSIAGARQQQKHDAELQPERVKGAKIANEAGEVSIAGARQQQKQAADLHPEEVKGAKIANEAGEVSIAGARQQQKQSADLHPEEVRQAKAAADTAEINAWGAGVSADAVYESLKQDQAFNDEVFGKMTDAQYLEAMEAMNRYASEGVNAAGEPQRRELSEAEQKAFLRDYAQGGKLARLTEQLQIFERIGDKDGAKRVGDQIKAEKYKLFETEAGAIMKKQGINDTEANRTEIIKLLAEGISETEIVQEL